MKGKLIAEDKRVFDVDVSDHKDTDYVLCPLCSHLRQKHPNEKCLGVTQSLRTARCNHCGAGFKFVYDHEFRKGITTDHISTNGMTDLSGKIFDYMVNDRKISERTLISRNVKMAKRNLRDKATDKMMLRTCIAFVYSDSGVTRMIKYRDKEKNFAIEKGSRLIFYGLDWIRNEKECVIVEGEIDALSYHEAGITNVVSVPNGVTISEEERRMFEETGKMVVSSQINMKYLDDAWDSFAQKEKIYIGTDNDAAGIKLREELIRRFGKERCAIINFRQFSFPGRSEGCKDANDVLVHHGIEALTESIKTAKEFPLEDVVHLDQVEEKLDYQFRNGREKGISTGYPRLDPHFRWRFGHLIAVNGYPNNGKTSFVFDLVMYAAMKYGWKAGIHCPENYPVQDAYQMMIELMIGKSADVNAKDRMTYLQYMSAKAFIKDHIYFVARSDGYTPKQLRTIAAQMISRYGIRIFVTDPWNGLIHNLNGDTLENYLEGELSAEQRFAISHNIIKIICAHPPTPIRQKETEYRAPTPFEIRGGVIWFNKAYEMLCVHIPEKKGLDDTRTEVHVQKVKFQKLVGVPTPREQPVILEYQRKSGRYVQEDGYDPFVELLARQVNIDFEEF